MSKQNPLVSSLVSEFASELGYEALIEPTFKYAGRIKTKDGSVRFFLSTKIDINRCGASEIAKDKHYASFFMQKLGYPVPEGAAFYSDELCMILKSKNNTSAAIEYSNTIGYPLIVKPNSQSQGKGVFKVYSQKELEDAVHFVFNEIKDRVVLVQKVVVGADYRIVVLDDEVLCAYRRTSLSVQGDGKSTIGQLLQKKQEDFIARERDTVLILNDSRIKSYLQHKNLSMASVVEKDTVIELLPNANLSSGGESTDVTDDLHESMKEMAIQLTKDMGLTFCGVDIMTQDPIAAPLKTYTIIEINSSPGLDYYAESGEKQKKIVKDLYKKLLAKMTNPA